MIPGQYNPQSWNRYSYVQNSPINLSDPSGHKACGDEYDCQGGPTPPIPPTSTPTPSPTNTPTSTPSPTSTPTATATPHNYDIAINLLQDSPVGQALFLDLKGRTFGNSGDCTGHSGNPILVPGPSCVDGSPEAVAGTIAHEAFHVYNGQNGTLLEEYQAFLVGDIVRNDIIQAGHGSYMRHSLSNYTIDLNNPNKTQLTNDLQAWFGQYEPRYVKNKPQGYGPLPALPPAPWWTWP